MIYNMKAILQYQRSRHIYLCRHYRTESAIML